MNPLEVKQVLSGVPPKHPIARAIMATISGLQVGDIDGLSGPPSAVTERDREYLAGRFAAARDLKAIFADLWAPSVEPRADPERYETRIDRERPGVMPGRFYFRNHARELPVWRAE